VRVRVNNDLASQIKTARTLVLPRNLGTSAQRGQNAPPVYSIDFIAIFDQLHFFIAIRFACHYT
jgi:hypothetical protein